MAAAHTSPALQGTPFESSILDLIDVVNSFI